MRKERDGMVLPIIIPTQKEEMSKKRIFALALAMGMLSTQSGVFAKTIADQNFNVAEDVTITYPETNIWGGWSTVNPSGYRQSKIGIIDEKMEFGKIPNYSQTDGVLDIGIQKSVSGVTENDDYLVFEFDWYVVRTEAIWSESRGIYVLKNNGDTAVMPPFGSKTNVAWKDGFGLYYTNSEGTDIPLFFMSIAPDVQYYNTLWLRATLGEENPTATEPKISRVAITDEKINLTGKDTYRYKFVIDLKNKVNDKYPYELYLKAGDGEYVELTNKADQTYTLTAAEIPSKIRIANQIRVTPVDTTKTPMWTYDFDGDGEATPFVEKGVVDNYQCYTIDTDETVSKVTYLDGFGNATENIVAGETYKASVTYNNETENSLSLAMITSLYDADEYFYNSFEDALTVPKGMGTLSGEARVFDITGGDLIRGFAWNNMKDMVPYGGFDTITAEATPAE